MEEFKAESLGGVKRPANTQPASKVEDKENGEEDSESSLPCSLPGDVAAKDKRYANGGCYSTLTVRMYIPTLVFYIRIYVVHIMCTVPTVVLICAYVCTEYTVGQLRKQNWDLRMSESCEITLTCTHACTHTRHVHTVCTVYVFTYSTIVAMLHLPAL